MQFQVESKKLAAELQGIAGVIERKVTVPMLENVWVSVDSGTGLLTLKATDFDMSLVVQVPVSVGQSGTAVVPARRFLELVRLLPTGEVKVSISGSSLILACGKSRTKIALPPLEAFPQVPVPSAVQWSLPAKDLELLLTRVAFSLQKDVLKIKPELAGVRIEVEANHLRMVSTDTYRLSMADLHQPDSFPVQGKFTVNVPRKAVEEVVDYCKDVDGNVQVSTDERQAHFLIGGSQLSTRLLASKFPEYEKIIPTRSSSLVRVGGLALFGAISRLAPLVDPLTRYMELAIKPGQLRVSTQSRLGEGEEILDVEYDGPEVTVGLMGTYLLDILRVVPSGMLLLQMTGPRSQICLYAEESGCEFYYILAPMQQPIKVEAAGGVNG